MKKQTENTKCLRFSEKDKTEYLTKAEKGELGRKFVSKEKTCLQKLYNFLPNDKMLNSDRLEAFFSELEKSGISKSTQRNYKVYINHVLDYFGCEELRLMKRRTPTPITYKPDAIETEAASVSAKENEALPMTIEKIDEYIASARNHQERQYDAREPSRLKYLHRFLPEDKILTYERLIAFYDNMKKAGISKITREDYGITINRFLDYHGFGHLKRDKGRRAQLEGKRFGELLVIERTENREHNESRSNCFLWRCECSCGNMVEVPTNQLTCGNVRSCGHLKSIKHAQSALVFIENTCIHNVLDTRTPSHNKSGRKGVSWDGNRKKWVSVIQYKKKKYYLGRYDSFQEAVKAREKAENIIRDDAIELLEAFVRSQDKSSLPERVICLSEENGILFGT